MAEYSVVRAEQWHADHIGPQMLDICGDVLNFLGGTVAEAIKAIVSASPKAMTGLADGEPIAMFGVARRTFLDERGHPWLAAPTRALVDHRFAIARAAKMWVASNEDRLTGMVDADNPDHVRFLQWLGFDLGPIVELAGKKFHEFYSRSVF